MLYFYLDNGSNVCGLEFNYKNGEEEGDLSLKGEKEDKKLEEGEETKQYKMEGSVHWQTEGKGKERWREGLAGR